MTSCRIKRGIFTLRECGNDATDTCTDCGSHICQEHTAYSAGQVRCPTCHRAQDSSAASPEDGTPEWEKPGWAQGWRSRFYRDTGYHPFAGGGRLSGGFDETDRAGFKTISGRELEDEEDETAGFSDS